MAPIRRMRIGSSQWRLREMTNGNEGHCRTHCRSRIWISNSGRGRRRLAHVGCGWESINVDPEKEILDYIFVLLDIRASLLFRIYRRKKSDFRWIVRDWRTNFCTLEYRIRMPKVWDAVSLHVQGANCFPEISSKAL